MKSVIQLKRLLQTTYIRAVSAGAALLYAAPASAQGAAPGIAPAPNTGAGVDLSAAIGKGINAILWVIGVIAVIFIIIGGIRYMISQGDEKAAGQAKNTILYAIIGLVVVLIAGAVVNFVLGAIVGP